MPSKQHARPASNTHVVIVPSPTASDQDVCRPNIAESNGAAKCLHDWPQPELLPDTLCALECGTPYVEAS